MTHAKVEVFVFNQGMAVLILANCIFICQDLSWSSSQMNGTFIFYIQLSLLSSLMIHVLTSNQNYHIYIFL